MKAPVNHFKRNRKRIQDAALSQEFLKPLTKKDIPYDIIEIKNVAGTGKLRTVSIDNIPCSDELQLSYVLDMEIEKSIFSKPEHCKTVEKAILIFSAWSLYVLMVEMKSTLKPHGPGGLSDIQTKVKDSIERISRFLTHYFLDTEQFNDYPVNYHFLLLYNKESITTELKIDHTLKSNELAKIFIGEKDFLSINDSIGDTNIVKVFFRQNAEGEDFEIDLNQLFDGIDDFENAVYSNKTLP